MMPVELSPVEKIEYYLGKDRLPNLHWKPEIPATWHIPPKHTGMALVNKNSYNTTITLAEGIPYRLNNLGYRSDFDYMIDDLKNKQLILCVGDSDTFGRGLELKDIYSTVLQTSVNHMVINLGIPGLSPDGAVRVGVQTLTALKQAVTHVCILWPGFSCREFVSKKFACGTHRQGDHVPYTDWYDHIDWVSNNYNYQKNRFLLAHTAGMFGAKFHELSINHVDKNNHISYKTVTSGNQVFSELDETSHSAVANYFSRKILGQPSLFQQITQS